MSTKFEAGDILFNPEYSYQIKKGIEAVRAHYKEYFEPKGWVLDEENESLYMILDGLINLNVGDYITLETKHWILEVVYKVYEIKNQRYYYELLEI